LFNACQNLEKDLGGMTHRMGEMENRENNGIQEIRQLERHIDHLTHQLEMSH